MMRSSADNMKPPTVIRKRNRNGTYTWIGLFVGHDRYYLSPAEALSLADRLVDAAGELSTLREPVTINGTTTGTSLGTNLEPTRNMTLPAQTPLEPLEPVPSHSLHQTERRHTPHVATSSN